VRDEETGRITIRVPKPRLAALLETSVQDIRERSGKEPLVSDIVWLYELCKEYIFPSADDPPSFLVPPVTLGAGTDDELTLYEPTVLALTWLTDYAAKWWESGRDLAPAIFAYAHSGGDLRTVFRDADMLNKGTAMKRVSKWFKRLPFTDSELVWAYDTINGTEGLEYKELGIPTNSVSRDKSDTPFNWGNVVATLAAIYQMPPDHFVTMNESSIVDLWEKSGRTPIAEMLGASESSQKRSGGAKGSLALNAAIRDIVSRLKDG